LLQATARQIADQLEKSSLIHWVKLAQNAVMALGTLGLSWRNLVPLLRTLC